MLDFLRARRVRDDASPSLPQRWKRNRRRAAMSSLVAVALFAGFLHRQGSADVLGAWWLRARFSLREKIFGAERNHQIAIVEIDDKSLDKWSDEPFIFWGGHFADAINHLSRSGARVIALDWIQTIETDEMTGKNNDQRLGEAIDRAKRVVLVKFVKPSGGYVLPAASLRYALPDGYLDGGESHLGFADIATQNSVQTAIYPDIKPPPRREVSFAQRIVEIAGVPHPAPALRDDGSMLINFANGTGHSGIDSPFERVSLLDVATAKAPDPRWKDKIVLIGATYKGNNDFHFVPFMHGLTGAQLIPGVEVQANAVKTLLNGDAIVEPSKTTILFMAISFGAIGVALYALRSWGRASFYLVGVMLSWTAASFVLFCTHNFHLPVVVPFASLILGAVLMGGYRALSEERERAQVMKVWGRHQDPRLIEVLLAHPEWRGGEGREVLVTVLFADLKDFTKTVESLPPAKALEVLNRYLSLLSGTILEHGGVVDKYLGDGLMAQWGAPAPRDDHATAAMLACLDIEKRLRDLTPSLQAAGEVTFDVRLTLHTGPVVAGPLGSEDRLEYTIIGDTVNVTSRLQETAKQVGCDFLISETTFEALGADVKPNFQIGREVEVAIRGRQQPLRVFEVLKSSSA